jgi:hypothetical protein
LRIENWRRVDTATLDDVKGELARGHPVVFGMSVAKDFETLKGEQVYAGRADQAAYGHAMVVAAYDEERQAFKVANSWGEHWGAGGFGWVSYDAFLASVDRAFVMRAAAAPAPAPVVAKVSPPAAEVKVAPPPPPPAVVAPPPAPSPVVEPAPPPPPVAIVEPPAPAPTVAVVEPAPPAPVIPPRPEPPSAPLDPRLLHARIGELASPLDCARISHRINEAGAVELTGFAASATQKSDLRRAIEALAPGRHVDDEALQVRPWPQCEALSTFDRAFHRAEGLQVKLVAPSAVLRDGDRLVLEITTPPFPAYIYVTYLQASGDAVHLHQPRGRVPRATPPSTTLRIGEAPGPTFRIGEPFGPEMIVVLASASPLFDRERPPTQIEREYLTEFRTALIYRPPNAPRGPERRVAAAAAWLTTAAR